MLQGKLKGSYRKAETGNRVFTYLVSGNPEELKAYEAAQGDRLVLEEESGKPLYFSTRYVSDNIKLIITTNGNVVTDDTEIGKMQSLVDQYGLDVATLIMNRKSGNTAPDPIV